MEPPRSHPIAVPHATRPARHFAYSFDDTISAGGGGNNGPSGRGYISPDPTPTSAAFYAQTQAHPKSLGQSASYTTPRGYPAGIHPQDAGLFTTAALHGHGSGQGGYRSPLGDRGGAYEYAGGEGYGARVGRATEAEMDPFFVPALTVRKEDKKGSPKKARKVSEVKQPTFLTKLYGILEQKEYNHILRWDQDGETIVIERPSELGEKVLPLVYRQSRFASFSRQLNIYGWRRKVSLRHIEEGITDPDASTWSHTTLHRHSPIDEIVNFKRRVGPRPSQAKRRHSVPEQALSPTGSDLSDPDDAYHRHLLSEDVKPSISFLNPANALSPSLPPPSPQRNPYPNFNSNHTPPDLYRSPDGGYDELVEVSPFSDDYPLQPEPMFYRDYQHQPSQVQQQQHRGQNQAGLGLAFGAPSSGYLGISQPNFSPNSYDLNLGPGSGIGIGINGPSYTPYLPHSAPPDNAYMQQQVYQAHLRTRSVQGELPTATLWSPAPYGSNGGNDKYVIGNSWNSGMSAQLSAVSVPLSASMEYQSTPIAHMHEGWVNSYTNEPMSPPQNSLGMIGARMALTTPSVVVPGGDTAGVIGGSGGYEGASSIPTSFAPSMVDGSSHGNTGGSYSSGSNGLFGLGEAFQLRPSSSSHTQGVLDSLSSSHSTPPNDIPQLPSGTVSPGIYHSGFTPPHTLTPPLNFDARSVSSPRPHAAYQPFLPGSLPSSIGITNSLNRHERRQSISSTPYSPRQRQQQPLSLNQLSMSPSRNGPVRGLGGMSDGYKSSTGGLPVQVLDVGNVGMQLEGERMGDGQARSAQDVEEEGLPSAGMEGFAESPFAGLLKEEMMDGEE